MTDERDDGPYAVLDDIQQDGYIVIDTRHLEQQSVFNTQGTAERVWVEVMYTQKFMYGETEGIAIDTTGIRINLRANSNGARDMLFWPWSSVLHYTHRTNSTEIAEKVRNAWDEYEKTKYAEHGIEQLEHVLNGEGPHGPGCHCNDNSDVDGYPIAQAESNPCDDDHHIAVMTKADIWVCLECAARWNDDGELLDG